ncbi:beta-trefoil DNA-binding domain-containing protein [Linnemannia elongata]|nr:beta-trefoil DNA-binding domain-containing protein [Linnemannia elongata]KAK5815860.1 beta-trefoil DNA-binding domain-containing protein [Linnemannia elongata]
MSSSTSTDTQCGTVLSRQVFESKDPSTRYQMTTISCLHASVAQKSYGSEKRFLCPPPIVNIQAPHDGSNSALSSRPQVTMSVICETGDNNSALGQRSTLEDDRTGTFRYLYVTGTAKAKSFQLKLQVYDRACLPNGFVAAAAGPDAEEGVVNVADLPAPYAVFDSAPIAIISKPSKKTAKARNVSSCILAGSLVSLFNRINSQTVRTKYMSVQDGEFCAKNSTWSAFSITIVANGPCGLGRMGSPKSHHRQSPVQSSSPITYGAEIILTETETGIQTDRLIVCKVENGRIQQNATGPICQMQKVALMSTERNEDGEPVYLSAVGNDHQVGRYMDHSTTTKTLLNYQASTMIGGNPDFLKPGGDDFLCWTIVGISKFEYTYFESLPAASENETPHPITPFPTLMKNPVYNAASHTLELVVSNFHAPAGAKHQDQSPMDVWLGSRGPLKTQIIRRTTLKESSGEGGSGGGAHVDQTTLLVDLPQSSQMGVSPEEKSISLPLLFVRQTDGITYNSRAKVVFTCPDDSERWTVSMA